jgi:hypothetical protein
VVFVLAAITHIDGLFGPLHCDGSAWLYMAQQRDRGLLPYRDLWENKLPPMFLVYRLAWTLGSWRYLFYAWDVCLIAVSACYLWRTAFTFVRAPCALTASMLYVIATAHPALHYGAAITEAYALPLVVLGFCFAALYRYGGGRWYPVLAGAAWTWGVCFRMPAVLSGVALVPFFLGGGPPSRNGSRRALLVGMVCGVVLGLFFMLIDPVVTGYWGDLFDICVVWALRYAVHGTPSMVDWPRALGSFAHNLSIWWGLHFAAIMGLFCGVVRLNRLDAWKRLAILSLLCWYVGDLLSTFPTLHQYSHNHYMTLGSLSLAAALFCDVLTGRPARWHGLLWVPSAVLIGYASCVWIANILPKTRLAPAAPGVVEAAEYLRQMTEPDEPVLLWVWLDEAELLWRVNRPPPSRHFSAPAYFMTDVDLLLRSTNEILTAPPRYAIDSQPYVPLLGMPADVIPTTRYEIIRARYRDLYEPVAQFGNISVYRRKPGR